MTKTAKFLAAMAVFCLVLGGIIMLLGVGIVSRDLATGADIIYGEGEDFYSDAVAFRKPGNDRFLLVLLPHARPAYRWVVVDFGNMTLAFSGPPRSLGSWRFRLKRDEQRDLPVGAEGAEKDWFWHFTEQGAAFSGNGFTFRVRKP